jgi:hypothetical protein
MRPLGMGDWAFDNYVIYFSEIVSALSLGIKIGIGAPDDYKDCVVSWEGFGLLLGFLDLWRRWRWWVGFDFYLGVRLAKGMLSVELTEVVNDWLWCNDRIDNMPVVGLGYFGKLVVERAKDRIENIAGSEGAVAWCG